MNSEESRQAELDARLRRVLGGLDASAGFEERVMQRVAMKAATAPRENLRAQFELRRALLRRRLLREAWMSSITILGIGACAFGLLWRYAPDIERLATGPASLNDIGLLVGVTIAVVGTGIWFVLRRVRIFR